MSCAELVIVEPSGEARQVTIEGAATTIGSDAAATVCLRDEHVAALHLEIHCRGESWVLVRRAVPVWVNGRRSSVQPLQDGDLIGLGRCALSFRRGGKRALGEAPAQAAGSGLRRRALALDVRALKSLHQFTRGLFEYGDPQTLATQLLTDVVELTGAHRGMLVLFEEAGYRTAGEISSQLGSFDGKEAQLSHTAMAKLREERKPRLWTDIGDDVDLAQAPSLHGSRVRSLMAAPILVADRLLGALYLSKSESPQLFDQQALDLLSLYANQAALLLQSAERDRQLSLRVRQVERDLDLVRRQAIVGSSAPMERLLSDARKVARSGINVLLLGETGTGKELLAQELHRASERAAMPFVAVNCGAIPAQLLESELFGHTRGAFTDAREDRTGRIRGADKGVLFLDEIGEMPLDQQAKLLRVLEEREVTPLGGDRSQSVDFRLICATNRPLLGLVDKGTFRRDLYYRIADVVLEVPPLRQRGDDAVELAHFFLNRHAVLLNQGVVRLSAAAMTAIRRHNWPGNVRELAAAVRRALVFCEEQTIQPAHLGLAEPAGAAAEADRALSELELLPLVQARDTFIKRYVEEAVGRCGGNRSEAAKRLMVTPRTIFKYLEEV